MRASVLVVLAACGSSSPPPAPLANAAGPDAGPRGPDPRIAEAEAMLTGPVTLEDSVEAESAENQRALTMLLAVCDEIADPHACELAAETLMSWQYWGVTKDDRAAAIAFDRACNGGNAHACYRVGFYILEGVIEVFVWDGALRKTVYGEDDEIPAALVQRACDMGVQDACDLIREDERLQW